MKVTINFLILCGFCTATNTAEISISGSSIQAVLNESFTITCSGNVNDTAIILQKNSTPIVAFKQLFPNGTCDFAGSKDESYKYTCREENDSVYYKTIIPENVITEDMHLMLFECSNPYTGIKDNLTLYVAVPVTIVKLSTNLTGVQVNKSQSFSCRTDMGRPNAIIQWYLSDGSNLTAFASTPSECISICNDKVVSTSILEYKGNRTDHGKHIFCNASNVIGKSVRSQDATINIVYGPYSVVLIPSNSSYRVTEYEGSVGPIICTADCRPNCTMTWSGPNLPSVIESELNLQNMNRNHTGNYMCTARNNISSVTSGTVTVVVEYRPTSVVLFPSHQHYTVKEGGSLESINCTADCRPNCTMRWHGPNLLVGMKSVLELKNIIRNQTGEYQCTAKNSLGSEMSKIVTVVVEYGPSDVVLFPPTSSYTVNETEGSVGPINCTANCRPNCTMTWSGPNIPVGTTSVLYLQTINKNQTGDYICTANNSVGNQTSWTVTVIVNYGPIRVVLEPSFVFYTVNETSDDIGPITCIADCRPNCTMKWRGPNLFDGTNSVLNLNNVDRNQTGKYHCVASNIFGRLDSEEVDVVVNYGPNSVVFSPSYQSYTVNESDDLEPINCTADCRPKCSMTWSGPILPGGTTSVLYLKNITRNQTGEYRCTAKNIVSSFISRTIPVVVNYIPAVIAINGNLTYSENDTAEFRCIVDSTPESNISWRFKDRYNTIIIPQNNEPTYTASGNVLKLSQMSCLSMGLYSCEANNGLGVAMKSINVTVMCSPRLNTFEYDIPRVIAVRDNEPLNISAWIIAFPKPWIYWQFINNNTISNITSEIDSIDIRNRHLSTLFIPNMTQDSFGFYAIYAENEVVESTKYIGIFDVQAARRPDKPSNVTCLVGISYVIVKWKPEFDGGSPQRFRVYYKNILDSSFIKHKDYISEDDYHPVRISNLRSSSTYLLKIHAVNEYSTTVSNEIYCNTKAKEAEKLNAVGIGAGIGSAVGVFCVVVSVCFVFRRLKTNAFKSDKEPIQRSNEEKETEDLTDNPLYLSGDLVNQDVCSSRSSNDKNPDQRNKPIEMGCVYENPDGFIREDDQIYANQPNTKDYKLTKNKDGLIYADLDLAPVTEERRFVIRGLDNRNNYAIIDLDKTADPLSSDDEDVETTSLNIE